MNLVLQALLLAVIFQIPGKSPPQLTILVLNGVSGKPIDNARLLVFAGTTDDVRSEQHSFDLHTDATGTAIVPPGQMWAANLLIFVDFMTQCEPHPNLTSLSVPLAMQTGLVGANSCGSVKVQATPGQLVVFARKPTLRERIAW